MGKLKDTKPYFTEEQYEYLDKLFPEVEVLPGKCTETTMYNAGARKVVQVVGGLVQGLRRHRVGER